MSPDLAVAILGSTSALIVVLDPAGRVVHFNAACEMFTGIKEAEVSGQVLWPFVLAPDTLPALEQDFPGQLKPRAESLWRAHTGTFHHILWSNTELLDAEGRIEYVVATGLDVTEMWRDQQDRLEKDARFQALFEGSPDGAVLLDPHDPDVLWPIVDCNETYARMNGYLREELIGRAVDLLHEVPVMARRGQLLLERMRTEERPRTEGMHRHRNGTVFPVETSGSLINLGGRELVLALDRDISQRRRTEAQLQALSEQLTHDAHHDALTGLPNRTLLYDRLTMELARSHRSQKSLAVLFVDLDDFKLINDTLGHAAGDEVLREVARRLQVTVRPSDTVARIGGDEFVILLPDFLSEADMLCAVQRIQIALAVPLTLGNQEVNIRSSIGVARAPLDGQSADALLSQADQAMYQAKRRGKNGLRFFLQEH